MQNPGRPRSTGDGFSERELPALHVKVSGRALCVWVSISLFVCGLHLSLFAAEFRETWYAPLHFLWVVAGACAFSWWCLCPELRRRSAGGRWTALLQAGAFLAVSLGVSWAVARVPWGGGVVGETRLPLAGGALMLVSLFLIAVSPFLVRTRIPLDVSRKADRS